MHARKPWVWPTIEEFKGDVFTYIPQQAVVAYSETILGVVTAGIPSIDGSHGTGIRSEQRREREDAVAIFAAACCQGRNHGMSQPRKQPFALTAVIQRVFLEGFRERIARRRSYRCDAEVRPDSLAITLRALLPFRRSILHLANASSKSRADDGIRAESVEGVVAELRCLRRTHVREVQLRRGCACNSAGGVLRIGR